MKFKVIISPLESVEKDLSMWRGTVGDVVVTGLSQVVIDEEKGKVEVKGLFPVQRILTTVAYTDKVGTPTGDPSYGGSKTPLPEVDGFPDCPTCNSGMVLRQRKTDGRAFWGCSSFPTCKGLLKFEDGNAAIKDKPPVENEFANSFDEDDDIPF